MIIVLYSRINRGGAEVRRLGGADAQAQAPPYAAHACSAAHVLDRISPIFSPFLPPFFAGLCAFSLPGRGGTNEPQAGAQGQEPCLPPAAAPIA